MHHANINQIKARVAILISGQADFKAKRVTRQDDKWVSSPGRHGDLQYVQHQMTASKYENRKFKEIDTSTIGDLNTLLSMIEQT